MQLLMTRSVNIARTIIIIHLTLLLLCRLLLVRLVDYIVKLSDFYSYRLIGKLTAFLHSGVQSAQFDHGFFHFRRAAFSAILKSKCGSILAKASALRINLDLEGKNYQVGLEK